MDVDKTKFFFQNDYNALAEICHFDIKYNCSSAGILFTVQLFTGFCIAASKV